jgi:hypothetical protein
LENLSEINLLVQRENISFKVAELERLVAQPSSNYAQLSARVKTRVKHLTDRLSHVRSLGPLPAEVSVSATEEHTAHLTQIKCKVFNMPGCDDLFSVQQDFIPGAAATNLRVEGTDVGYQMDFSVNLMAGPVWNAGLQHTVCTGTCILPHLFDPNRLHITLILRLTHPWTLFQLPHLIFHI